MRNSHDWNTYVHCLCIQQYLRVSTPQACHICQISATSNGLLRLTVAIGCRNSLCNYLSQLHVSISCCDCLLRLSRYHTFLVLSRQLYNGIYLLLRNDCIQYIRIVDISKPNEPSTGLSIAKMLNLRDALSDIVVTSSDAYVLTINLYRYSPYMPLPSVHIAAFRIYPPTLYVISSYENLLHVLPLPHLSN